MSKYVGFIALAVVSALAGCSSAVQKAKEVPLGAQHALAIGNAFSQPALLGLNDGGQDIGYWPITGHGGRKPHLLAAPPGIDHAQDIAADSERIAIANTQAQNVLTYDLRTGKEHTLPDTGWFPLYITLDRHHAIYVVNTSPGTTTYSVTKYAAGQQPVQLTCGQLGNPDGIAVDSAGNIFVNENSPSPGVIEFPAGKANCRHVVLQSETGFPAGLAIDPRNDDLLVLSNPGECAGDPEGLITFYPKPYKPETAQQVLLGGSCPNFLRLSADEKTVFVVDGTVSGAASFVNQFAYPSGSPMGTYYGGQPGVITTIPNKWP